HLLTASDPAALVPLSVGFPVRRHRTERDADPALGLRLGRHVAARRLGLVGYVMAMSRNLGDALDRLSRYYAILREGVECRIDRGVESVTITLRDRSD